jgi:tryptophanase
MGDEGEVQWVMQQNERFTLRLQKAGVPLERGCDGAYIETALFLPHISDHTQDTFSAALYLSAGVRAIAHGRIGRDELVPVQIPRLAMTNEQLDQVADAIIDLYRQRDNIPPMRQSAAGRWRDQMAYHGVFPDLEPYAFDTFPYEIHTFERIGNLSRGKRERAIRTAGFNTFLLRSADVAIDLLTEPRP